MDALYGWVEAYIELLSYPCAFDIRENRKMQETPFNSSA
jgi:hypothetical protein